MPEPPPWTTAQREDFFAAIARHRRASWQVAIIPLACTAVVMLVVAMPISALQYVLVILLRDLLSLVIATPDLFQVVMEARDRALDDSVPADPVVLLQLAALAALP